MPTWWHFAGATPSLGQAAHCFINLGDRDRGRLGGSGHDKEPENVIITLDDQINMQPPEQNQTGPASGGEISPGARRPRTRTRTVKDTAGKGTVSSRRAVKNFEFTNQVNQSVGAAMVSQTNCHPAASYALTPVRCDRRT